MRHGEKKTLSILYWLLNRDPQQRFIIILTSLGRTSSPSPKQLQLHLWSCDRRSETWPWLWSLPHGDPSWKPLVGLSQGLQDAFVDHQTFLCDHFKLSRGQDVYHEKKQRIQTANLSQLVGGQCLPRSFSAQMPPSDVPHEKLKCLQQHRRRAYIISKW